MTADRAGKTRMLLVLVLLFGSHLLSLGVGLGLLFVAYALWAWVPIIFFQGVMIASAVSGILLIVSSIPAVDRFNAPGPRLERAHQPRLFAELDRIAESLGLEVSAEVYLTAEVNAFVAKRGGILGLGGRRVMGLGLPLMQALTVSEFRAALLHEFGHFHAGDTSLRPFLHKTYAAVGRSLESTGALHPYIRIWFVAIARAFLRSAQSLCHDFEFAADRVAAQQVGPAVVSEALWKSAGAGPFFESYFNREARPFLLANRRPRLAEGFGRFLALDAVREERARHLRNVLEAPVNLADTHPRLKDRIQALGELRVGQPPLVEPPAVVLLDRLDEAEAELLAFRTHRDEIREFPVTGWDHLGDVTLACWVEQWKLLGDHRPLVRADVLPQILGDPRQLRSLGRRIHPRVNHPIASERAAVQDLGLGLALALARHGFSVEAEIGRKPILKRAGAAVDPFELARELVAGSPSREAARARLAQILPPEAVLGG